MIVCLTVSSVYILSSGAPQRHAFLPRSGSWSTYVAPKTCLVAILCRKVTSWSNWRRDCSHAAGASQATLARHHDLGLILRQYIYLELSRSADVTARSSDLAFIAGRGMAYLTSIVDIFALLLFFATIRAIRDYQRRGGLPYPPGPRPLPIVGNLFDIPKQFSWLAYTQLSKKYGTISSSVELFFLTRTVGNILSLHTFGQVIVILNTVKAVKDLLEKRGDIYPDRPPNTFYEMWALGYLLTCRV